MKEQLFIFAFGACRKIVTAILSVRMSSHNMMNIWKMLYSGTQVCGFAPGRSRRVFRAKKILSTPSFGGEVKPSVPCRNFTACKRSLNVTCNSAFRQNYRTFLTHSSTFRRWVLSRGDTRLDTWWQKFERLTKIAQ
jgi:hypothetical protein